MSTDAPYTDIGTGLLKCNRCGDIVLDAQRHDAAQHQPWMNGPPRITWASPLARPLDDINQFAREERDKYQRGEFSGPSPIEQTLNSAVERHARARHEAEEARIRAELTRRVQAALEHTVDNGEYGDASGHLGGDGFTAMAEAAVDAFTTYLTSRDGSVAGSSD